MSNERRGKIGSGSEQGTRGQNLLAFGMLEVKVDLPSNHKMRPVGVQDKTGGQSGGAKYQAVIVRLRNPSTSLFCESCVLMWSLRQSLVLLL